MNKRPYPEDSVQEHDEDNGTMPENIADLESRVVGHRIVSVQTEEVEQPFRRWRPPTKVTTITLDSGKKVILQDTDDCCAYTEVKEFLLHPDRVDHVITGVQSTDGFTKWHVYADMGDVLELTVGWSAGNAFYYGYGFDIEVVDA